MKEIYRHSDFGRDCMNQIFVYKCGYLFGHCMMYRIEYSFFIMMEEVGECLVVVDVTYWNSAGSQMNSNEFENNRAKLRQNRA
jgi:hypothetical protein